MAFASLFCACGEDPSGIDTECEPSLLTSPATASGTIAITHVNVLAMENGDEPLRDQTVLVANGLIAQAGSASSVTVPPDALVLDGKCRYLMPGLADMHVHLTYTSEALLYIANGVTTVREMWGSKGHLGFRDRIASRQVLGPRMFVGSPGLDGIHHWPRTVLVADPAKADTLVAQLVADEFDFLKVYEHLSASSYDAIVQAARARSITFAGHASPQAGLDRVLAAGQRSIEHMGNALLPSVRTGGASTWWDSPIDAARARQLGGRLAAAGVWLTPTLVTLRAMMTPSEEGAFHSRPEVRYLPPGMLADWGARGPWGNPALRDAAIRGQSQALEAMAAGGTRLLIGTDGGFTYIMPGFAIHEELEMLVNAGLSPALVLRAATRNAAEFMGRTSEFGSVVRRARADLLLLNANPLREIGNVRRRAGVIASGQWVTETELQRRLETLASSAARATRIDPTTVSRHVH
jgi:imidazolonepropionase-like amidohydrolase